LGIQNVLRDKLSRGRVLRINLLRLEALRMSAFFLTRKGVQNGREMFALAPLALDTVFPSLPSTSINREAPPAFTGLVKVIAKMASCPGTVGDTLIKQ
jgi:hypothetical protein